MVQPLLVSMSAISLASETVRSIMKIDDIVSMVVTAYLCALVILVLACVIDRDSN